jgi:integrase
LAYVVKRSLKRGGHAYLVRYQGLDGRVHSRQFRRRVDAERFANGAEVTKADGTWIDPARGRMTLAEWVTHWEPSQVHLRPSSRARDESYLRCHVLPRFGARPLTRVTNAEVRAWVADLTATGLAPSTVSKAYQILAKLLRAAVDDRRIPSNPADRVPLPRIIQEEMRFLTPAQVRALADAIDTRYRGIVVLGAYSGLRLGEMLALRWGRVDLLRGRVEVAETCSEVKGRIYFGPPKTKAGRRTVPIPNVVVDELAMLTVPNPAADQLVFTGGLGAPLRAGLFRQRVWYPATRSVGFDGLRIHDLRHTAVALWIAVGATPKEIAVRAGHSSVVTVLDRYGHLYPQSEDRLTEALDAMADALATPGVEPVRRSTRPSRKGGSARTARP